LNRNLQPRIHPDADQLSVFVEGAATAREREKMLAHLAECSECRKEVFLMQPREEPQQAAATPEKGWIRRWLVPVGLPAAVLACGLIAVSIYLRPRGEPATPQQMASARQPEAERPGTTVAPTARVEAERVAPSANADQKATINSERVARSEGRQNGLKTKPAANLSGQQSQIATDLNLPANSSGRVSAGAAPQLTVGGPITSIGTADSALAQNTISTATASHLPLNGRNSMDLQQLQPAEAKGAASQDTLAGKKGLPALQTQGAKAQNQTLAGISGRITDRTGAVITGATVTLRDTTGKARQTTTGTDGSFHLTQLQAGHYELTATASGFKSSQQSIQLEPNELAMLQPVLDIGAASETVEVQAASAVLQTESANVSGRAVTEMNGVGRVTALPSGLPVAETVSHGKRFLSLDHAGNLFLSPNAGKKWKKIKPRWAGKAIRIEWTPGPVNEAAQKAKDETPSATGDRAVFLLTTDGGTVWSSKDGVHWHQQ
jgi:hypothetical protein